VRTTAQESVVVLIDEPCAPLSADWLGELAGLTAARGVGAAAGFVVDGTDRIVNAGIALPNGLPLPVHFGARFDAEDLPAELTMVTNRSAATALSRSGGRSTTRSRAPTRRGTRSR